MQAVIYARYSAEHGAAGPSNASVEIQTDRCEAYCMMQGYEVVIRTSDKAISGGRVDNRPGLLLALEEVCSRQGVLVVYSLSRLARNVADAVEISNRLQRAGAHLSILDLGMDTATPIGRCVFAILAAVAELERNQIAERMVHVAARRMHEKRRMGTYPTYGYAFGPVQGKTTHGNPSVTLVPIADEQQVIQIIKHKRARGVTIQKIAAELKAARIPCRRSYWKPSFIAKLCDREGIPLNNLPAGVPDPNLGRLPEPPPNPQPPQLVAARNRTLTQQDKAVKAAHAV